MKQYQLTQHVTDVDHDGSGFRRDGSELVANCVVVVALPTGADLQAILTVALEKKRKTSNIGMTTGSPGTSCIFRSHVVNQAQLCKVVRSLDVHGLV